MKKELKDKWVDALRSGKYTQTTGQLCRKNQDGSLGYCCLGVLCDLVDPDGWISASAYAQSCASGLGVPVSHKLRRGGTLGHEARGDLGLWIAGVLSLENDQGSTFAEIADHIQKEVQED